MPRHRAIPAAAASIGKAALLPALVLVSLASAAGPSAAAQFSFPPQAAPPKATPPASTLSPEAMFRNQCGICHTLSAKEPMRQGPPLAGVIGRKAGTAPGFNYSAGFANVDFRWDAERLDAYLTNPQAVVPGSMMAFRQPNPVTRKAIVDWLKEQH